MDAIITAAGKNSRMINDFKQMNKKPIHKLKLKINNKPILVQTIEKVLNSDIENCTIVLGYYKDELYQILKEYELNSKVNIKVNSDVNVGLSKSITNAIKDDLNKSYVYLAADQPTITTKTINNLINTLENSDNPKNTISILRRREIGKLNTAEGLGMPFCAYGKLLYDYLIKYDENINPILREMISDNVEFYAIKEENELELVNINHYEDYIYVKKEME